MRGLRKDNTGYDLKHLFIGAEGTLGIITGTKLRLHPKNTQHITVFIKLLSVNEAAPLLRALEAVTGGMVSAFELVPGEGLDLVVEHIPGTSAPFDDYSGWSVLLEVSHSAGPGIDEAVERVLAEAIERGSVTDAVVAKNERDRQTFWRLREAIPEAQRKAGPSISNDISVQPHDIPELIARAYRAIEEAVPGARPFSFGHVGDGNIHLAVRAPLGQEESFLSWRTRIEEAINEEVERLGGSISAEHGLGLAKNNVITRYKSETEIAVMRSLKAALDPRNILNPGKLLPDE
jgi:FAD/FMN-containing dehydrogenase